MNWLDKAFVVFVCAAMVIVYSPINDHVAVEVPISFGLLALMAAGLRTLAQRRSKGRWF